MGNFFSDIAGGFLGQGPGTDTISGYEGLGTIGQRKEDIMRGYLSEDPGDVTNLGRGRAIFAPNYEALSTGDIEKRVGRVRGAYEEMFNPFLNQLQQGIDADLSRSGLLTSTRSAALRAHTLGQLAVQSALPMAELQNALEEQNRQDVWNRRMQILGSPIGNNTPATISIDRPQSMESAYGSFLGRVAPTVIGAAIGGPVGAAAGAAMSSRYQDDPRFQPSRSMIPQAGIGGMGPR